MKHFQLSGKMTTIRGVFYPTGHMVLMFPTENDAMEAANRFRKDGLTEDDLSLASPAEFEQQIENATDEHSDLKLPSFGTEAKTAKHLRELARAGHYALIVHAGGKVTSEHVLDLLKDTHMSCGERYRYLVIEDLVT